MEKNTYVDVDIAEVNSVEFQKRKALEEKYHAIKVCVVAFLICLIVTIIFLSWLITMANI